MGLKIRLRQQGRRNRPFYRLVVTDVETKRDGKYVETLGWYNPVEAEADNILSVNAERVDYWLSVGAQLTEKAEALVKLEAPQVIRKYKEKALAHQAKITEKKRLLRRKKKEAA